MKFFKAIVFILIQTACFGQSTATVSFSLYLADIATIALAPSNSIVLVSTIPSIGGSPLTFTSNNNQWINFTSAVSSGTTRNINVQITSGSLPNGTSLKLKINPVSGTAGGGTRGNNVASIITLSSSIIQNIITDIGDGYTGTGAGNGYNLTFELVITDFSQLRAGTYSTVITFTIT